MSLYTMSTPYEEESGDWFRGGPNKWPSPERRKHHKAFFETLADLDPVQRDEALKSSAIENIRKYPVKYIKNWVANVGRLLFNYPLSYTNRIFSTPFGDASNNQSIDTFITLLPNVFIFVALCSSLIPFFIKIKNVAPEMIILFMFAVIYLLISSLVSAYIRQFYILIPYWFLFIGYVFNKILCLRFRENL